MKILFIEPSDNSFFSFRKELFDSLIRNKHDLYLCTNVSERIKKLYKNSVNELIHYEVNLKSKNVFSNLHLKYFYKKTIKRIKPDLIISYKIKPNIYCGFYAKKIPMIANITGLGNMFKNKGPFFKLGVHLYRKSFKNISHIFFQNQDGFNFFKDNKIPINNYKIIPGSGVNTDRFRKIGFSDSHRINFLFASRAIKEKGFDLLVRAIPNILSINQNVCFNFVKNEEDLMKNAIAKEIFQKYSNYIKVVDRSDEMEKLYSKNDFTVAPSYYREGISNILIESLACETPIITTNDNFGCKEVLQEGINGFGVKSNDFESLINALVRASYCDKKVISEMGRSGRKFVVEKFNRNTVIKAYLDVIESLRT